MTIFDLQKKSLLPLGEAEILMAFLLGREKEFILTHPEFIIPLNVYKKFKELEKKRLAGWSIAVLIGHKEFYGLDFKVNRNVLVPRPETEMMVDEILNLVNKRASDYEKSDLMLVDLGTGTGAIIISAASEIEKINHAQYENIIFRAIDISAPALNIAKKNAILNKQDKKIKFLTGNLLEPLINQNDFNNLLSHELIIAANLPYLTPNQVNTSPSIKYEPRLALVAGSDGLKYYRELFGQIKAIKKAFILSCDSRKINHFKPTTILCEIDPGQNKSLQLLTNKYFPTAKIKIKKDLAKKNRLAIIQL